MTAFKDVQWSVEELLELVAQLQQQIEQLQAVNEQLRRENEALRRKGGSAAPFSKGPGKANHRKPGRKSGEGHFTYRINPAIEQASAPIVEAPVAAQVCPDCGGALEAKGEELASITDLPEVIAPQIKLYRVQLCQCVACGKRIRGKHPELAPDQHGATAHRMGEKLLATAHVLHHGCGVPVRKVPQVLWCLTGVRLTQSAITQDSLRRSRGKVGELYQSLREEISQSPVVHTDDTGWRVAGQRAHLMLFESGKSVKKPVCIYQVRSRHRNEEVREMIPSSYRGVLCTDRGRSYDAKELERIKQQKCLSHVHRSIAEALEGKQGGEREFGETLKKLLREAVELSRQGVEVEKPLLGQRLPGKALLDKVLHSYRVKRLKKEVTAHLKDRKLTGKDQHKDNQRLLNELGRHHDRGNLLRFLDEPGIEPTNNKAERALRPAVIARKVSQCSKNDSGAQAFCAFMSIIRTIQLRAAPGVSPDPVTALVSAFQTGALPASCG